MIYDENSWDLCRTESINMGFPIRDNADLRGLLELASILEPDVVVGLRKMAAHASEPGLNRP